MSNKSTEFSGDLFTKSESKTEDLVEMINTIQDKYKIGLLWCHSHVELRLIEVEVD